MAVRKAWRVCFADDAWEEYVGWSEADLDEVRRINELIENARRTPHAGLGKPQPLQGELAGWWSRRITGEHRLVYRVEGRRGVDQQIVIAQCRFHY